MGAGFVCGGMVVGDVGGRREVWNGLEMWFVVGAQAAGGWGTRGGSTSSNKSRTARQFVRTIRPFTGGTSRSLVSRLVLLYVCCLVVEYFIRLAHWYLNMVSSLVSKQSKFVG